MGLYRDNGKENGNYKDYRGYRDHIGYSILELFWDNGKENVNYHIKIRVYIGAIGGPPHPVIVTIRDKRDYIKVLLYSYCTTITGWGLPNLDCP